MSSLEAPLSPNIGPSGAYIDRNEGAGNYGNSSLGSSMDVMEGNNHLGASNNSASSGGGIGSESKPLLVKSSTANGSTNASARNSASNRVSGSSTSNRRRSNSNTHHHDLPPIVVAPAADGGYVTTTDGIMDIQQTANTPGNNNLHPIHSSTPNNNTNGCTTISGSHTNNPQLVSTGSTIDADGDRCERVYVHHHAPEPEIRDLDDLHSLLSAPTMLSAARTLDINLRRVKKGRLFCVSNMCILGVCLGLQMFAWFAYYNRPHCDKFIDGGVSYSMKDEVDAVLSAITAYDPTPVTGGSWLPAIFAINGVSSSASGQSSSFQPQQAIGGTVQSAATLASTDRDVTVTIRTPVATGSSNSTDEVVTVGTFTSHYLEASLLYSDLATSSGGVSASGKLQVSFTFANSNGAGVAPFSRTIPLTLDTATWTQGVVKQATCFAKYATTTDGTACDEAAMTTYCSDTYGTTAVFKAPSSSFSTCDLYDACGKCEYTRYLSEYTAVVRPQLSSSIAAFVQDTQYASPLWPFNNKNVPPFRFNPQEDVSTTFVTPGVDGAVQPTAVLIRVYKNDDPTIVLNRYTQGLGTFTIVKPSSSVSSTAAPATNPLQQQHQQSPPQLQSANLGSLLLATAVEYPAPTYLRFLSKDTPNDCGIPEMLAAWGVFVVMFIYLIVICKKFPNFGLEADMKHDVMTEYEDYDRTDSDDENEADEEKREKEGDPHQDAVMSGGPTPVAATGQIEYGGGDAGGGRGAFAAPPLPNQQRPSPVNNDDGPTGTTTTNQPRHSEYSPATTVSTSDTSPES